MGGGNVLVWAVGWCGIRSGIGSIFSLQSTIEVLMVIILVVISGGQEVGSVLCCLLWSLVLLLLTSLSLSLCIVAVIWAWILAARTARLLHSGGGVVESGVSWVVGAGVGIDNDHVSLFGHGQ